MEVNVKEIYGEWDLGYSLDKHTVSSTPVGYNEFGHMQYDTTRSEAGEALKKGSRLDYMLLVLYNPAKNKKLKEQWLDR